MFLGFFTKFKKYIKWVEVADGVLLIIVGVLIMTNNLIVLSAYFARWFPFLNELS